MSSHPCEQSRVLGKMNHLVETNVESLAMPITVHTDPWIL